jgi:outer membrane protein OmpA-like peptidoglycan-associated protein
VVSGEVEDKDLRNELNARVAETAVDMGFKANPAIRWLDLGPSVEEIEELQVNLDELIEGKVVEFQTKSYELTDKGKELLDEILDALRQAPEVRVSIAGHTDDRGSESDNHQLSLDRANAVLEYLMASGESRERFVVIGYGESRQKESNSTKEGRARNRRIEFIALEGTS